MKHQWRLAAAALCGVLFFSSCGAQEVVPELLDSAAVSVDTEAVKRGTIYDLSVYHSAVVPAVETASFLCSGKLSQKYAVLGQTVEAGEVLAELDTEDLEEQIAALEEEITFTKQDYAYTLEQLELKVQIAELELKQLTGAGTGTISAAVHLPLWNLLVEVLPSLPEESQPEESEPESSEAESSTPESSEPESSAPESSQPESSGGESSAPESSAPESVPEESNTPSPGTVSLARSNLEQCRTDLQQEKELQALRLEQMAEKLEQLKLQVQDNQLVAPVSGTIVYETSTLHGETLQAYQPVYCIADETKLSLSGDEIAEAQIRKADHYEVQIGGDFYPIEYQSYSIDEYSALVLAGEETPSRFQFTDDSVQEKVWVGEYAAVYLYTSVAEDVLYLPVNALHTEGNLSYVYVMKEEGQERVTVETGVQTDSFVEIASGLQEGDVVYVQE